jgi:hypothetical protein
MVVDFKKPRKVLCIKPKELVDINKPREGMEKLYKDRPAIKVFDGIQDVMVHS